MWKLLPILLLAPIGCMTVATKNGLGEFAGQADPSAYSGVRAHLSGRSFPEWTPAREEQSVSPWAKRCWFEVGRAAFIVVDLPLSFVADTLLLLNFGCWPDEEPVIAPPVNFQR
jgi:uncharacterized protein YceK